MAVIDGMPVLASEWMENGTMNEYLKKHVDADILAVVCAATVFCPSNYSALMLRCKESRMVLSTFTTSASFTRI